MRKDRGRRDTEYEGYKNQETWACALYVNNERPRYEEMLRWRRDYGPFNADKAMAFCVRQFKGGRLPDGKSLEHVDWQEIADDFNAD